MGVNIAAYPLNKKNVSDAVASTSWHQVMEGGSTTTPGFPNLPNGCFVSYLRMQSKTSAGANGSGFYYKTNVASAPTDATADGFVGGSDTTDIPGDIRTLWVRKLASSDVALCQVGY